MGIFDSGKSDRVICSHVLELISDKFHFCLREDDDPVILTSIKALRRKLSVLILSKPIKPEIISAIRKKGDNNYITLFL